MRPGILFLSYNGMLEPLGSSQVLAYLEQLSRYYSIHLISFERQKDWADPMLVEIVRERTSNAGIAWYPKTYHKRPSVLATCWDIAVGALAGVRLARRHGLAIVHARSYVASAMAVWVTRLTGARYLFDMRGFWADERVDGGLWPAGGRMYRIAKGFERSFLEKADHVVSLTQAGVREIHKFPYLQERCPPMTVIPTCADLAKFRPLDVERNELVIGYVGSAGTWYLFDVAAACFKAILERRPDARLLILNRSEHDLIRNALAVAGVPVSAYELRSARHDQVPVEMARMHAGLFFIKPVFSKQASAPTKLGEFLGCGIPCLSNQGVGDMAEILESEAVGVAVSGFEPAALEQGVGQLLDMIGDPGVRDRCVAAAHRHFSLEEGVRRYRQVYRSLLGNS